MEISLNKVGQFQGQPVFEAVLTSEVGVKLTIISYGAIVRDWQVPINGSLRSMVLGFPTFENYLTDTESIGAIVGRVANRIAGAKFTLNGETYHLPANVGVDHLHGGPAGLARRNWSLVTDSKMNSVTLRYHSPEGEMGYPGAVDFCATYTLKGYRVTLDMKATVSKTTPINMVQHHYFNLAGQGDILDHTLQVNADKYTPLTPALITTGEVLPVDPHFDFRQAKNFKTAQGEAQPYDINFALNSSEFPAAVAQSPDKSATLSLWTDQPGLQLYTGEHLPNKFSGFCLEDQQFPDAVNKPQFPSIWVTPEQPYRHQCIIEIK